MLSVSLCFPMQFSQFVTVYEYFEVRQVFIVGKNDVGVVYV